MKRSLLLVLAIAFIAAPVMAQDSTYVKIANDVLTPLEAKHSWIAPVLAVLFILSEALAAIPAVKANGIFQLVSNWIGALKK